MGKSENMVQHVTRFLLGTAVAALVCVLYYRSKVINGGTYKVSLEAFALPNATQASSSGASGNEASLETFALTNATQASSTGESGNEVSLEAFALTNATQASSSGASGNEVYLEAFALTNATQASSSGASGNEVASFGDDHLLSREDQVNQTTVLLSNATLEKAAFPDLLPLLQRVATDDKTVIITSVNEAWAKPNSLLDIFLEGFHVGEEIEHLLDHLIVITLDPNALQHCQAAHRHCYLLMIDGMNFTAEKVFMSNDYIDLVWTKVKLQRRILELGYNFLFTDVDILWLRNPFTHITVYADLTTSSDMFSGDPDNIHNFPNTGFIYVKSTKKTIEMMDYWIDARKKYPGHHEQNVFNFIKADMVDMLRVKVRYIDTTYCGGFCNHGNDLNKICTMHANCCVGLYAKLHDLRKIIEDWKFYMALSMEQRRGGNFTWTVPGLCIH